MTFGGRFPILVVLVLGLVVAGTKGVPWVLKQFREPTPVFRVDDVRNLRYVPPYGIPPEWDGDHNLATVRVHGPSVTSWYSVRPANPNYETLPPVDAVITVAADEMADLPDGEQIGLSAIALIATRPIVGPVDGEMRVEGVFHPSGRQLSVEEVQALLDQTGFGSPSQFMNPMNSGHPWKLQFVIKANLDPDNIANLTLRDSVTGGVVGARMMPITPLHPYGGYILETVPWPGVHTNPMTLHLLVRQGGKVELEFEPAAPQILEWMETSFELEGIFFQSGHGEPIQLLSGKDDQRGLVPSMLQATTTLSFHTMVDSGNEFKAQLKNGRLLSSRVSSEKVLVQFPARPEDIEAIVMVSRPRVVHVAIELPQLPGIPEHSREVEDIRDMVLPPAIVENQGHMNALLASVLQMGWANSLPAATPSSFPLDVGGMSVRQLLHSELARYPDSEIAITSGAYTNPFLSVTQAGQHRRVFSPSLGRAIALLSNTWLLFLIAASLLALIKGWILMRAHDLHRILKMRGYRVWSFWDAERAYLGLGRRAWNIPSRDELGALPGVDGEDVRSVVEFIKGIRKEQ